MLMKFKRVGLIACMAIAGTITFGLTGCGDSSTTTAAASTPAGPSTIAIAGVAATGAPFAGATVSAYDATGAAVAQSVTVAEDGSYTINVTVGAKLPYVIVATRTNADGATENLVSFAQTAVAQTLNVTPVTTLIASKLSASGDPTKLASEVAAGTAKLDTTTVAAKVAEIQAVLKPVLDAVGVTSFDPLGGKFTANGTGYDRLLDSISVKIVPAETSANIEIGVKQQQTADTDQPTVIQFSSKDTTATIPTMPAINTATLVASGTSGLISALLKDLNACYALPLASRVNSTISGGLATGTAANVTATECRSVFSGGDPANYLSNGARVGRDANNNGAFASLFRDGATGVVFSQGAYEFTRSNGDIIVSYKARDTLGGETYDSFVVRNESGKLRLIGNQYTFGGGVNPYHQLRESVFTASDNYYSTGYDISIPLMSSGTTTVTHVLVGTPKGTTLTFVRGSDGMVLPRLNSSRVAQTTTVTTSNPLGLAPSGTSYVRVRTEYVDKASTNAHPSTRENGLFFVGTDDSDATIATYGAQSVWTFNYYSGNTLLATQAYKTRNRAMTIGELRTMKWANLNAATLSSIASSYDNTSTNAVTLPTSQNVSPVWEVPSGAAPPTNIKLFGKTSADGVTAPPPFVNFSDSQNVNSTVRSVSIGCSNGNGEVHCAASGPGYRSVARGTGLHLWNQSPAGQQFAHFYSMYKLP